MTSQNSQRLAELEREVAYFRGRHAELAASLVQADAAASALRHELEQKRRGFSLLARFSTSLGPSVEATEVFRTVSEQINPALNMQRTAVLTPAGEGLFQASILQGYARGEADRIREQEARLPTVMLQAHEPLLLTKESDPTALGEVQRWLALPYFITMPVVVEGTTEAVIVTGRLRESHPFMPRLGKGDAETVQAISAFVAALVSQRRVAEIEHMANHDALTGLPNVRLGTERLQQAIASAGRIGTGVALLYIDLDGFKAVNDGLGHVAGDATLREVAQRLRGCVRETDTVARVGGDEFIVILPSIHAMQDSHRVADAILAALARPIPWQHHRPHIGASIGIVVWPDDGFAPDELLRNADRAMYAVKHGSKNAYRHADKAD